MSESDIPLIDSVFLATDFSPGSESAFAHALAIALFRQTRLDILYAGSAREDWSRFPSVRGTLERWGLLEPGSAKEDVFETLGIDVTKISAKGDPVDVCVDHIARSDPGLVVLGTAGREGPSAWLRPSISQRIARRSRSMSLFVPKSAHGFVDARTGRLGLHHILVPIAMEPDPTEAIVRVTRTAALMADPVAEITLLHVGHDCGAFPSVPDGERWRVRTLRAGGEVVPTILEHAADADVIAMVTEGRDGFLDALRGSVTEQVVRSAPCPVLAVPAR